MTVSENSKYFKNVREIPVRDKVGSFAKGALMDGAFLGLDSLSIRYGLVDRAGMIEEETDRLHTHDHDQVLWFVSSDAGDLLTLGAEVEYTMGEELIRQRFDTPSAIFIPKGTPHFSPVVDRLDRPFFFVAVSCAPAFSADVADPGAERDGGPWGEFMNRYARYRKTLTFARKGIYHYGSAMASDSGGVYTYADAAPYGFSMTMSWETVAKAHKLGPRTPEMGYRAHMHPNYDELLIFLSMDPEHLGELPAQADFCFGKEEDREHAVVTKPTVMVNPAGTFHLPLQFDRVDAPVAFITLSGNRTPMEGVPPFISEA